MPFTKSFTNKRQTKRIAHNYLINTKNQYLEECLLIRYKEFNIKITVYKYLIFMQI